MSRISKTFLITLAALLAAASLYFAFTTVNHDLFSVQELMMDTNTPRPEKLLLSKEEWKARLTPEQYHILREKGTEPAFTGKYAHANEQGIYECAACALPLFSSKAKYDSGTGWPSFWEPLLPQNILYREDYSFFTKRVEVLCARCESHLGHVFEDGPPPTGLRYCLNSLALKFVAGKKGSTP